MVRHEPTASVDGRASYSAEIHVLDISATGALIEVGRFLDSGTQLSVRLPLRGLDVSVRATVVHCSATTQRRPGNAAYRAGLRFIDLSDDIREEIREYIRESLATERREQPRLYIGQPSELNKQLSIRVVNLSLFGGLFTVDHPLPFDSEHTFVFDLPSGEVHVRGVVKHCEAWLESEGAPVFRLGVEFVELAPESRRRVLDYIGPE